MMNKIEIERLINSSNIKYEILVNIVNEAFVGSTATEANIYVDLYSILNILYGNINIEFGNFNTLASCIVNIAAHYRHFFRTRYGVDTSVYFIYSTNTPYINNQFIKDYNAKNKDKILNKTIVTKYIKNNIDVLKTLIDYLPNIYLIESEFETGVCIYDLMCRTDLDNRKAHIILTKDIYNYQLVNMKPQTIILRPKSNDSSFYINEFTLFRHYFSERKIKKDTTILSPSLLSMVMSLSSVKERNINMIFTVTKAVRLLEDAVKDNKILNGYNSDIQYVWDSIWNKDFPIEFITFNSRFKSIDIMSQYLIYINSTECINIENKLVNIYAPESVKHINNKYFKNNPLDLNRL